MHSYLHEMKSMAVLFITIFEKFICSNFQGSKPLSHFFLLVLVEEKVSERKIGLSKQGAKAEEI